MWISIGLVAAALRLGAAVWSGRLWHPELWEYERIANHLLHGDGFVFEHMHALYRSYCEPLYPWLVAGVYAVGGHRQWVLMLVQIVLSSLIAIMAAQCAWRMTRQTGVAVIAGLLIAVHPGLIVYTMKCHPLVLDALLLTLVAWSTLTYADRPTVGWAALLGLLVGLCMLTRPTVVVALPLIVWWMWRTPSDAFRRRWQRVAIALVVLVAVVSPWVLRNYAVHGRFMLTRSNTPFVFWLGNNPQASGSALDQQGREVITLAPPDLLAAVVATDELGQNRLFGDAALAYVRADPWGFVRRTWQKWTYFWWRTPQAGLLYPHGWLKCYQMWWACLVLAGLWGVASVRALASDLHPRLWLLLGMAGIIGATQSLFYIEGRHRLAIEPLLAGLIAFGLMRMWRLVHRETP